MINKGLSKRATAEDRVLLKAASPLKIKLLGFVGKKWRLKRIPMMGTVISDPALIRAVMDSTAGLGCWGQETAEDGFAVMSPVLMETVSETLSAEGIAYVRESVVLPMLLEAEDLLHRGEPVDIVGLTTLTCYLSMWRALGLSEERLKRHDFDVILRTLRSATEVLHKQETLSGNDKDLLASRLTFLTTVVTEAYNDHERVSLPSRLRDNGWSEEAAVSLTQRVFLSGADSVTRFIPRMAALFVKTRYIDHLSADISHLPVGLDEAYRTICPIPSIPLRVNEPVELNGITVAAGEKTILSMVGASLKFGDFDPFKEEEVAAIRFGEPFPLSVGSGDRFARLFAEEFAHFLAQANSAGKLQVVEQSSDDRTHVGTYKRLVVVQQQD